MTKLDITDHPTYTLQRGQQPLLISIPHLGTLLPDEVRMQLLPEADALCDTDWHLDHLYDFALDLGVSVLGAKVSRYAIDLNRPATGESLYPGQATTGLCPTQTFRGDPLYAPGHEPDAAEVQRRLDTYWRPYHQALQAELDRLRALHGQVLLWEAHSIASVLPLLFDGKLPDFNFGTAEGRSCAPPLINAVLAQLPTNGTLTHVHNGRFKGGHITRHYGQPSQGVHAIQLEMCQSLYMEEAAPFAYRPDLALQVQPLLKNLISTAITQIRLTPSGA
ncbi:MAG: N-formylglutamate deformylase [Aquabacterium sp.]|uniref:N-formylglutamate deformylase n=1 Tax=Aquabacterium sp. TaxID=1872578 RepID=UPI00272161E4|nr:N-formylglutamate deformylase [Aquabacterium sp.]MDO9002457.1 N-formylglutamate deformylase [Aquabacterium sp.]